MESPFFSSSRHSPRYRPSTGGFPPQRPTASSPKVINVPVHFVGSERPRSDAALKIQKAFRGFLVRKSIRKIAALKREVEALERTVAHKDTVELIRKEAKHRLKINETLMSLLLKLDSVRGVDAGVRDCRKAVIKKAVMLQEKIDAIVAAHGDAVIERAPEVANTESVGDIDQAVEWNVSTEEELESEGVSPVPKLSAVDNGNRCNSFENGRNQSHHSHPEAEHEGADNVENCNASNDSCDISPSPNGVVSKGISVANSAPASGELKIAPDVASGEVATRQQLATNIPVDMPHEIAGVLGMHEAETVALPAAELKEHQVIEDQNLRPCAGDRAKECEVTLETESRSDSRASPQCLIQGAEEDGTPERQDGDVGIGIMQPGSKEGNCLENIRSRELLERIVKDNERIMSMMAELFDRNEMQRKLLSSLSQRVGQLEKAFVLEKMRKKKKGLAASVIDGSEKCPDGKKCGKR